MLGVGIVGCGAATQAIHLAALARFSSVFRVVHCVDADAAVAAEVARRCGAPRSSVAVDDLLADPAVDVVLVASPGPLHAAHVVAACQAGKRAVLCEKPLAESVSDASSIVAASRSTGVPVLVGTMHRHDPVLAQVLDVAGDLVAGAVFARSSAFIPPNAGLVAYATEPMASSASPRAGGAVPDRPLSLLMFEGLVMGLAIHHLPLVRLSSGAVAVIEGVPVGTVGYHVSLSVGAAWVDLDSVLLSTPHGEWTFEWAGPAGSVRVEFPPGYLASESARAVVRRPGQATVVLEPVPSTGYDAEWQQVAAAVLDGAPPLISVEEAAADVTLARRIVDHALAGA